MNDSDPSDPDGEGSASTVTWSCDNCTFENSFAGFPGFSVPLAVGNYRLNCEMCQLAYSLEDVAAQINSRTGRRICFRCTLLNPDDREACMACGSSLTLAESPQGGVPSLPFYFFLRDSSHSNSSVDGDSSEDGELANLMQQFDLMKLENAENFRHLRSDPEFRDCDPQDLAEAVRSCGDRPDYFDFVQGYFNNECPLCYERFPRHKLLQMASCQCKLCFRCFYNFVSTNLENNDHVTHLQCPMCNVPRSEDIEQLEFHFQLLMNQVTSFQHPEVCFAAEKVALLEKRLRDWNLMRDPSFRWCSHCPNGVSLNEGMRCLKFQCHHCRRFTCKDCRKPWLEQHAGISCARFEQWLAENDAANQERGVAAYLQGNGIQCRKCQFRYALAKGGCMHFTCRQCRAEFCSGCGGFFSRVNRRGLVCEHPRDCLFYLRDFSVANLQQLLRSHSVEFESVSAGGSGASAAACGVMEQKEIDGGRLVDEECGIAAIQGHANLCRKHYTEYLVSLVNRSRLDPVEVMDAGQLKELCRRHGVEYQPAVAEDAGALRTLIVAKVPLRV